MAGLALEFGRRRVLHMIVLPQALRAMAPFFVTQRTTPIEDTSLGSVIGGPDLSIVATQLNDRALIQPAAALAHGAQEPPLTEPRHTDLGLRRAGSGQARRITVYGSLKRTIEMSRSTGGRSALPWVRVKDVAYGLRGGQQRHSVPATGADGGGWGAGCP